jgi:FlaA1/EpsC-like NDP-sugar epimerase
MIRLFYRALRFYRDFHSKERNKIRTMVIGAGDAGNLLIKENINSERMKNKVVCVIDDDNQKIGKFIHGVPIVGNRETIVENAIKYNIRDIIIAMPSIEPKKIKEIALICQETDCNIKVLPGIYEMVGK